jgi:hypothetical protein
MRLLVRDWVVAGAVARGAPQRRAGPHRCGYLSFI